MSAAKTVKCLVRGIRAGFSEQRISFSTGRDLSLSVKGEVGPRGITETAADLIDLAAAIAQIERQLRGFQGTNPPEHFQFSMRLRKPHAWTNKAIGIVEEMLLLLGNAEWAIDFKGNLRAPIPAHQPAAGNRVKQIVLFSGGMDSTCGLTSIQNHAPTSRLVSFYTRQKSLQTKIAAELEFVPPVQWSKAWKPQMGPSHSFYYRSFLFLCLAAAVAESWKARTILQYENGVLASAIPPSPAWMMTKHAYPQLHKLASELFSILFGGKWEIRNPFVLKTKRDCFEEAARTIGKSKAAAVLEKTETCWFHWSNRVVGGMKKPGRPCGVCIPCMVRRTALRNNEYEWDLREAWVQNDLKLGRAYRSYFGFTQEVSKTKGSPGQFHKLLPAGGRSLVDPDGPLKLDELHSLFLKFSSEFAQTYRQ
jgi:7-cyano-7-deazaguanine synthase in queuosine biosynthesis